MGWVHSKERNRLASDTIEMITAVKLHYDSFAPPQLSSNEQAKRARFDAAVASSTAGSSLAEAAELPADLEAHIAASRQAAAAAGTDGEDEEEQLTADQLEARLGELGVAAVQDASRIRPPGGFATWVEAVRDAFDGWDFAGPDLLDLNYAEVFAEPEVQVRPPTFGQFDPAAMVQEELQHEQQQRLAQQQQLLLQFQQAGLPGASLQQHMLQEQLMFMQQQR
jgi:hypothetical protein